MSTEEFPKLVNPPINEVICGFIFDPAPIDILDLGVYWESRRESFPQKELHPALFDEPVISLGGSLLTRAWLIAEGGDLLLQLQHDRFYMNWRARGSAYPRFSDRNGQTGLKSMALAEWAKFEKFVTGRAGLPGLTLRRIELAKVDVLERGRHWQDHRDLGQLMRVATVFQDIQLSDPAHLQLRLTETDEATATLVTVNVTETQARIEARVILPATGDVAELLTYANTRLNGAFFGLLDRDQMNARFGGSS